MIKRLTKFLIFVFVFGINFSGFSQTPTIGLRYIDHTVSEGYVLFTPEHNNNVFLINNCGEVINEWEFTEKPGATCYLLENSNLLRAGKKSLEIRDWDNNVVWSFLMDSIGLNQHHDIEPLPNGNILCVITDIYSDSDVIALGRNPLNLDNRFKLDKIIEIQPIGKNGGEIVWEWKFIDHFIQDFDSTKLNFGIVADHPELIDINFDNGYNFDYTHVNAIDYNKKLDQIILSVRHLSEIIIIDHSVTTIEAKGSSGGNFNKGGDILWRWGNPQVYKQGTSLDQKLYLPHDSKWVEEGYLDEGKITVFNNGGDGSDTFSSIHLITPEIENNNYLKENEKFSPIESEWSWSGSILEEVVFEGKKSSTHALPNGNFILCETAKGQISEINRDGEILWVYKNPSGESIYNQFEDSLVNGIFRGEKYPVDYIGLTGHDLNSRGIIEEGNTVSNNCIDYIEIDLFDTNFPLISNPVANGAIDFFKYVKIDEITITDSIGRKVFHHGFFDGISLEINLVPGIYYIQFKFEEKIKIQKLLVL